MSFLKIPCEMAQAPTRLHGFTVRAGSPLSTYGISQFSGDMGDKVCVIILLYTTLCNLQDDNSHKSYFNSFKFNFFFFYKMMYAIINVRFTSFSCYTELKGH